MMRLIRSGGTNPAWNLAMEEVLLTRVQGSLFVLWRNAPSVIVGRNQNTLAEIDSVFVKEHNLPVIRRLTGGGAVFHDLGNINYTYIEPQNGPIDFARFARPVISFLRSLGVPAELSGRNDILAEGKKISGTAQTIRSGRVLHHGTLLYKADLSALAGALRVDPDKYKSKGVHSVTARVGNVADLMENPPPVEKLLDIWMAWALENHPDAVEKPLTLQEKETISALCREKYETEGWNYAPVRAYTLANKVKTPAGTLECFLQVDNGVITRADFRGDFFGARDSSELADRLVGRVHTPADMDAFVDGVAVDDYMWGMDRACLRACLL